MGKPKGNFSDYIRVLEREKRLVRRAEFRHKWGWLVGLVVGFVVGWVVCKMVGG